MAIDIEWFMPLQEFYDRLDVFIEEVRTSELRDGVEKIYLPGEIEGQREQRKLAEGVPLAPEVMQDLKQLAEELHVEFGLGMNTVEH